NIKTHIEKRGWTEHSARRALAFAARKRIQDGTHADLPVFLQQRGWDGPHQLRNYACDYK
ncbi:unnamed protein product, partial [Amoebophrya sp. A25]